MKADRHEWLCQQIVDKAQDTIIMADRDGVVRLRKAGAEVMVVYRAEEAVGRRLDLIITDGLSGAVQAQRCNHLPLPVLADKDGRIHRVSGHRRRPGSPPPLSTSPTAGVRSLESVGLRKGSRSSSRRRFCSS